MTESQIKTALRRNKKRGRRPWSLYQISLMRGCSRSLVTMTVKNPNKSRPLHEWMVSLLKNGAA